MRFAAAALCVLALGAAPAPPPTPVAVPARAAFVPNAALFSLTNRQPVLVDPEIFVPSPGAPPSLGFEQIARLTGLRNADMMDDASQAALDANGRSLGFDLQHWFSANGVVQFDPPDPDHGNAQTVITRFANLIARGRYSLFVIHLDPKTPTYAPLDATGKNNSFTAQSDGTAGATVVSPRALPPQTTLLLLVYHADHRDHGLKMGDLGIDAFHQLAVRVP